MELYDTSQSNVSGKKSVCVRCKKDIDVEDGHYHCKEKCEEHYHKGCIDNRFDIVLCHILFDNSEIIEMLKERANHIRQDKIVEVNKSKMKI